MVICQPVLADDIDVGLGELAVAALLRAFTSPDLLHLVAAERKVEVSGVLQHVTGERHRQIEVKAKLVGLPGLSMQAPDDVYLLVDLSFAGQLPERLNCPGLDGGEAMKLEGGSDGTEYLVLDQAPGGQELGETRDWFGACHGSVLQEIGLQVGVGEFLSPDGGGFPVPGQEHSVVREDLDDPAQGGAHLSQVAARQIGPSDGSLE